MNQNHADQPNILFLVGDHQAFYGHEQNYRIRRPAYRKLVSKGVDFRTAYCSTPLCCPSRRTIATGLYAAHHGQINNQAECAYTDETYMDGLKEAGYQLYYYGKWHAGRGTPADFGAAGVFCEDYGNPYLLPSYQAYLEEFGLPFPTAYIEQNWCTPGWIDDIIEKREYRLDRKTMNECVSGILTTPKETHEAFYLAHEACRQLERLKDSEKPFCLRVDFWGPHQPYLPTQEYADLYDPDTIPLYPSFHDDLSTKPDVYHFEGGKGISENYRILKPNPIPWEQWAKTLSRCYAQITMTDEAAGQILDKLEELGLADNTLIIWTADHGDGLACHGGHFDKDAYLAEEVLRIPAGVRFDGRIPAGVVSDALVSNVDFAPTILDAAGTRFRKKTDGKSLLSLWGRDGKPLSDGGEPWRSILYAETFGHHFEHRGQMITDGRYKYVNNRNQMEELYDLEQDPYELHNLALKPEQAALLGRMRAVLKAWLGKAGIDET